MWMRHELLWTSGPKKTAFLNAQGAIRDRPIRGRPTRTNILQQIYYGRYIMADVLQQIYYGRYITTDILWQIYYEIALPNHPMKRNPRTPRTSPEPPRDSPGTPLEQPVDSPRTPQGPPGTTMDDKNSNISTHLQRQKLSIAASESFCCNASSQRLLWTPL